MRADVSAPRPPRRDVLLVQSTTEQGGAESVLLNLLESSDALRRRSAVATLGFGRGDLPSRLRALGAEVIELPPSRLRNPVRALRLARQLSAVARDRAARVLVGNGAHPQVFAAFAARLAGARVAYYAHMIHARPVLANPAIDVLALRGPCDLVLANSTATLQAMRALRPRVPAELLHPGVPSVRPSSEEVAAARRAMGAGPGDILFAIFGRLQRWKGQDVFVEAAARVLREVPSARFAVVGGSVFELEPEFGRGLEASAAALGLGARLVFTGHRPDVPALMAACDVACHATRTAEPFGMVLLEAMAQARPVIATRGGGPDEIVLDGETGHLVPPGDAGALAAAMVRLGRDAEARRRMGAAALVRVERGFSAARSAERLLELLGRWT